MNDMRKLMESVQLNEESIEYRDPDGDFIVIYSFPRGYIAQARNDYKDDISGESFDSLDDAIEHAEICMSIADDRYEDDGQPSDYEEMQDYMGGDDWDHGQYDESVEVLGEEGDIGYSDDLGNVSQLTAELLKKHDEKVSKLLTSKFHGKTVELNVLGKHGGSRMTGWGPIRVEIERVSYQAHDVNGPVYITTDGKEYHSHPDHDVQ
jgi:hypothetical protein